MLRQWFFGARKDHSLYVLLRHPADSSELTLICTVMYIKYVTDQIDVHYAEVLKHGLDQEELDLSHSPE